jgi:hypothetical protein
MNLNIKLSPLVVVNKFEVKPENIDKIKNIFCNECLYSILPNSVLYKGISNVNELVLLYEVNNMGDIQSIFENPKFIDFIDEISVYLESDFHQEAVGVVEYVIKRDTLVPKTKYMQLRHIEVPLSGIDPYLEWRKKRIFEYVKRNDKVVSFTAFHSVFSSTPGVLFISEFDTNVEEYRNSFLTDEYKEIIKEAGHDHIKGGLYTSEYELLF